MNPADFSPLMVEHEFPVSALELYNAWTDEAHLKSWWKPTDTTVRSAKCSLEKGGEILYEFDNADFRVTGNYESIEPGAALRYSWNWDFPTDKLKNENFTLDIRFTANGDHSSILKVKQEGFRNQDERDAHEAAWEVGFRQLEDYLKK